MEQEKNTCSCSEICPFYKIFERIHKAKKKSETVEQIKSLRKELLKTFQAVIKDLTKIAKKSEEK